jgi:hypothetical protein
VYDKLGPIYYMTRYRSAVARKIDYFAAIKNQPGDDPENDLEWNEDGEIVAEGPATKVLEAEGGPELIRRIVSDLMVHWDVVGEAYLVRYEEEPYWRILSTQELKATERAYSWMDGNQVRETIDRDNVFRVWKPHPRNHWTADSPTRHVLEDAEGLILSGREIAARSRSRLSAGVWLLPDTVDFTPFGSDTEGTEDDFARELTAQLSRPLADPASASSLVPWIVTMNREDIPVAAAGLVRFDREWEVSIELREEQLNHVALGIDMPPELATGAGGSMNHWGQWWLTDEAVNMHVLPTVDDILDSLSINWFRPLLQAASVDPRGYVLWRDPSPATVPTDRSDIALKLYEAGAISGEALRRVTDFDEEDAPTPEELAERKPPPMPEETNTTPEGPPIQSSIKEGDPPLGGAAVTAAARRRIVATELAEIDAEILTWCVDEADKEIERLLGIVSKSLTAATDPIDESMLDRLRSRLEKKIATAQARAGRFVERLTSRTVDPVIAEQARSQGVQAILSGILDAVRSRLFTPKATPDPIDLGRMPQVTSPTEAIRLGLSIAGGGEAVYEDAYAAELIGNGHHVHAELEQDGFFADGFVWKYGHPSNQFEPHRNLNGTEFRTWEAAQLAVDPNDAWLRRSYYRPGDHKGCCCAFVQILAEASPTGPDTDTSGQQPVQTFPNSVIPRPDRNTLSLKDPNGMLAPEQLRIAQEAFRKMNTRWPGMLNELQEIKVSGDLPGDFLATKSRWQIIYNERHIGNVSTSRTNWADLHDDHLPGLIATKAGGITDDLVYLQNVTMHEMSHIGEHQFRAVASKSQVDRLDGFFKRAQTESALLEGLNPSYFAQENMGEFMAEALSDAVINVNPNKTSLQIAELFDEVFK